MSALDDKARAGVVKALERAGRDVTLTTTVGTYDEAQGKVVGAVTTDYVVRAAGPFESTQLVSSSGIPTQRDSMYFILSAVSMEAAGISEVPVQNSKITAGGETRAITRVEEVHGVDSPAAWIVDVGR